MIQYLVVVSTHFTSDKYGICIYDCGVMNCGGRQIVPNDNIYFFFFKNTTFEAFTCLPMMIGKPCSYTSQGVCAAAAFAYWFVNTPPTIWRHVFLSLVNGTDHCLITFAGTNPIWSSCRLVKDRLTTKWGIVLLFCVSWDLFYMPLLNALSQPQSFDWKDIIW